MGTFCLPWFEFGPVSFTPDPIRGMADTEPNVLYYGDNLDIVRRYVEDESVDLVYLDPPFQSEQDYNVLFEEQDGTRAEIDYPSTPGSNVTFKRAPKAKREEALQQGELTLEGGD